MSPSKTEISTGCREWSSRIPALLDSPRSDEARQVWERHAEFCELCRAAREKEVAFRAAFQQSLNPGSAYVAALVLDRIRISTMYEPLFRRRDLIWSLAGVAAGVLLGLVLAVALPDSASKTNTLDAYAGILSDLNEETLPYWTGFYVNLDAAEESTGDSVQ